LPDAPLDRGLTIPQSESRMGPFGAAFPDVQPSGLFIVGPPFIPPGSVPPFVPAQDIYLTAGLRAVPEPTSLFLLGAGLAILAARRRFGA
jgi:hypothetical protein